MERVWHKLKAWQIFISDFQCIWQARPVLHDIYILSTWVQRGRGSVKYKHRSGRPITKTSEKMSRRSTTLCLWKIGFESIVQATGLSMGIVHTILHDHWAHLGISLDICVSQLDHHCSGYLLVGCLAPSLYLNQCPFIVRWTFRNNLNGSLNKKIIAWIFKKNPSAQFHLSQVQCLEMFSQSDNIYI